MQTFPSWVAQDQVQAIVRLALKEDLGPDFLDITTQTLFSSDQKIFQAKIISKNVTPIVLCGLPLISCIFSELDEKVELEAFFQEGEIIHQGETLITLKATARALLMAERTILNFLQRLCAIATLTKQFTDLIKETSLKILDTRKTTPGLRALEKYAVFCGGGVNHRMGLYDATLIKDTHIDLLGGIKEALARVPETLKLKMPVIVEVRTLEELEILLAEGRKKVSRVLLDNMSIEMMREAVKRCREIFSTEASGNIALNNIQKIAETGVEFASVGQLTHSAGSVDLSMKTDRL